MENLEKFKQEIKNDKELFSNLKLLKEHLKNDEVLNRLFSLCRETFFTHYNGKIVKKDGNICCFITNEAFEKLSNQIKSFINSLDIKYTEISFGEVKQILEKYYKLTEKLEEKRIHKELNDTFNNAPIRFIGTLYDLNNINWESFELGLKENSKFE